MENRIHIFSKWIAKQSKQMRIFTQKLWRWAFGDGLFVLVLTLFFAVVVLGASPWWDWHSIWEWAKDSKDSNSETLRNLTLVLLGAFGLLLAAWRSHVAHKQTQISERGLLNERYQRGADMLGSSTLTTRLGGIHALERLAQDQPEEYHIQIMNLLCAFVRHPTETTERMFSNDDSSVVDTQPNQVEQRCRPDVEAAALAIGRRSQKHIDIERHSQQYVDEGKKKGWAFDLRDVDLSGAQLRGVNLENVRLDNANFSGAMLWEANFSNMLMRRVNLSGAKLRGAIFSNIDLEDSNLSSAYLHRAEFSDTSLFDTNLSHSDLHRAKFSNTSLLDANLSHSDLHRAKFSNTSLLGTNLSHSNMSMVTGLTQHGLDLADTWSGGKPPKLYKAFCNDTGKPLTLEGGDAIRSRLLRG